MPKKITLTAPHEHAGREYPVGAKLTLDDDSADWLISLGRAHEADAKADAKADPEKAPAKAAKAAK
jgi:hypothetical protein